MNDDLYYICFLECAIFYKNQKFKDLFFDQIKSINLIEKYKTIYTNQKCDSSTDEIKKKCLLKICSEDYCFHNYIISICGTNSSRDANL